MSNNAQCIDVSLGNSRAYSITIGHDLFSGQDIDIPKPNVSKIFVITNTTIGPLYISQICEFFESAGYQVCSMQLPDGEQYKNADSINLIYDFLLKSYCDRNAVLVALGGGVIGDMVGFAAATYQRGIRFIQIPTTLLAQVDSSVGGKTGINHRLGKNMVGAFWQPSLVLADTSTLHTLPKREFSAGMAEVVKYGLIADPQFLEWLEENMSSLMTLDSHSLVPAIKRCCQIKADIVMADEFEKATNNGRAILNFGHTFGHAIETGLGYGNWLHGEAVAVGMVIATELSQIRGWLSPADVNRVRGILIQAGLPVKAPTMDIRTWFELMSHDKKNVGGKIRFVLLNRIGQAITDSSSSLEQIEMAIARCSDL